MPVYEADHYTGGVLASRELWDTDASLYTAFDGAGAQTASRPFTAAETTYYGGQAAATAALAAAQATSSASQASLAAKGQAALAANITVLGQAPPAFPLSAAAQQALYNQVVALTKQVDALIRVALGLLSVTDGT